MQIVKAKIIWITFESDNFFRIFPETFIFPFNHWAGYASKMHVCHFYYVHHLHPKNVIMNIHGVEETCILFTIVVNLKSYYSKL